MNLSLERLLYDASNKSGAEVGAYIKSLAGDIIGATDNAGTKGLNVHVLNDIPIEVTLTYADDSVSAWQGGDWTVDLAEGATVEVTGSVTVSGSVDLDSGAEVAVNNLEPNVAISCANLSVTDAETAIVALSARRRVQIQNLGGESVYLGGTGVLTTSGLKIEKGATESLEIGAAINLFLIAPATKTVACRILQLS